MSTSMRSCHELFIFSRWCPKWMVLLVCYKMEEMLSLLGFVRKTIAPPSVIYWHRQDSVSQHCQMHSKTKHFQVARICQRWNIHCDDVLLTNTHWPKPLDFLWPSCGLLSTEIEPRTLVLTLITIEAKYINIAWQIACTSVKIPASVSYIKFEWLTKIGYFNVDHQPAIYI